MRFYGFDATEITAGTDGNLDLAIDPKLSWALRNRHAFPVDPMRADREALLRVPGFGTKTVNRIIAARRHRRLRWDDLVRMGANMKNARPFVTLLDWTPGALLDAPDLVARFAPQPEQLSLF